MKILVVDDNAAFRASFRKLLAKLPEVEDIIEAEDGEGAIQKVKDDVPDLIFMDITMPGMDGFEATHCILQEHPNAKIAILTVHANMALLHKSIEVGACGYILKNSIHEELSQTVEKIMSKEIFVSKTMEDFLNPKKNWRKEK